MGTVKKTLLLYMFRGRLETEEVDWFEATSRAEQLIGVTRAQMYRVFEVNQKIHTYNGNYWVVAEKVPAEIKLAAMLVD